MFYRTRAPGCDGKLGHVVRGLTLKLNRGDAEDAEKSKWLTPQ